MKILLVEDDPDFIRILRKTIRERKLSEEEPLETGFDGAEEKIKTVRPDAVVLDIYDGDPAKGIDRGSESLDLIWKDHFCPVIVYSANPERAKKVCGEHPFVRYVAKGKDGEEEVAGKLREIKIYVESLRDVREYVQKTFSSVMKEVALYVFRAYGEEDAPRRTSAIKQAARRRLAAQMDELSGADEKLAPWEQYIFPPISEEIRTGDILRNSSGPVEDPTAFRLVLTPSCDLERRGGKRKVENVLVSLCCPVGEGMQRAVNVENASKGGKKRIESFLPSGYANGIIPLPKLVDLIPSMAADLKRLETVPADEIVNHDSTEEAEYVRVASLDSPFREMVSWAYLQVAGRPGLPERDIEAWVEEISKELPRAERGGT